MVVDKHDRQCGCNGCSIRKAVSFITLCSQLPTIALWIMVFN